MQPWTLLYTHKHGRTQCPKNIKYQLLWSILTTDIRTRSKTGFTSSLRLSIWKKTLFSNRKLLKMTAEEADLDVPEDTDSCQPPAAPQPPYRLWEAVIPFPGRLACLANLSQCLRVNLTSWRAYWSASWHDWRGVLFCYLAAASLKSFFKQGDDTPGSAKDIQISVSPCLVSRYSWYRGKSQ